MPIQRRNLRHTLGIARKLAKHPDAPPEIREQSLKIACDWMQPVMDDQEEEKGFTRPSPSGPTHNSS